MRNEEDYFVQVTHRRPPPLEPPRHEGSEWPIPSAEAQEISAELTGQHPSSDGSVPAVPDELVPSPNPPSMAKGVKFRQLTPEQNEQELAHSRESDNPRVRAMFDMIDKNASGQALPDGVRVRQGDLFAPGLVITTNPFPDWFGHALQTMGQFEWNDGCVSYIKMVTGKPQAEKWAAWVIEILEAERKAALSDGRKPLSDTTEVMIREDHRALMNDILS